MTGGPIEITSTTWVKVHDVPATAEGDEVTVQLRARDTATIAWKVIHPDNRSMPLLESASRAATVGGTVKILDGVVLPADSEVWVKGVTIPSKTGITGNDEIWVPTADGVKVYTADSGFAELAHFGSGTAYVAAIPMMHKNAVICVRASSTTVDIFDLNGDSQGTLTLSTAAPASIPARTGGRNFQISGTNSDGDHVAFVMNTNLLVCLDCADADPENWVEEWEYSATTSVLGIFYNEVNDQWLTLKDAATYVVLDKTAGTESGTRSATNGSLMDFFLGDRDGSRVFAFGNDASADCRTAYVALSSIAADTAHVSGAHFDNVSAAGSETPMDDGAVDGLQYEAANTKFQHCNKQLENATNTVTDVDTTDGSDPTPLADSELFVISDTACIFNDGSVLQHLSTTTYTASDISTTYSPGGICYECRTTGETVTVGDGGIYIDGMAVRTT